ncbi:DNA-binding PadR family transcriptional regulator [Micromonospora kangleipakensis]|uniref:DNA-binding PadR family transcriptional regulator n=1 Tax=Micromonospora kangleipakensis TaxID=1077942 RepID=A0A4Q8BAJ3_9ACTN|nr:PadR family transcriptional regulator [Micromonospora kangleipakensis]RZU74261.1 DNA-binding PadR family transcriptional regulator [Micromonospora kangleipakensis]
MRAPTSPFGHGQFKLYLLALLRDQPRHGYEVIKLIEETFAGAYAPSAGAVYPRLSRLETEGLVSREVDESGRKVYRITSGGEEELRRRAPELDELTREIDRSIADITREADADIRAEAAGLRAEARRGRRVRSPENRRGWFRRGDEPEPTTGGPEPTGAEAEAAERPEERLADRTPAGRADAERGPAAAEPERHGTGPEDWGPREWREALSWGAEWRHEWSDYFAFGRNARQVEKMVDRFREDARRALQEGNAADAHAIEECRQALGEALVRIRRAVGV